MPRLSPLRPWLGLAFLASAGICCLNPQPEPPTESAATADPGNRDDDGPVGSDGGTGKGSPESGGTGSGEAGGTQTPPDTDGGHAHGGDSGAFGSGAGGTRSAGGGRDATSPPPGGSAGAGAGGSGDPTNGVGGIGGSSADADENCGSCGQVLGYGGTPCPSAVPTLAALVACCAEACGPCRERIVRGDRVGAGCLSCLEDACPATLLDCKAN